MKFPIFGFELHAVGAITFWSTLIYELWFLNFWAANFASEFHRATSKKFENHYVIPAEFGEAYAIVFI